MMNEPELVSLVAQAEPATSILMLPEGRDKEGSAIYDDKLLHIFKRLRADGLAVEWAADPEHRTFRAERSVTATVLVLIAGIPFSILSNAAWDGIKRLFAEPPHDVSQAKVEIIRLTNADGSLYERMKFEGSGTEIAKAMAQVPPPAVYPAPKKL